MTGCYPLPLAVASAELNAYDNRLIFLDKASFPLYG
jgi:hypothetical protein